MHRRFPTGNSISLRRAEQAHADHFCRFQQSGADRVSGAEPTSPPITSSSASFNLLPVPQPTDFVSTITCSESIGGAPDPVAIVQLQAAVEGTGDIVLRDYAIPPAQVPRVRSAKCSPCSSLMPAMS